MAKLDDKQRFVLYSALLEGLDLLVNQTEPNSELASLIMGREHIIDALGFAKERGSLH